MHLPERPRVCPLPPPCASPCSAHLSLILLLRAFSLLAFTRAASVDGSPLPRLLGLERVSKSSSEFSGLSSIGAWRLCCCCGHAGIALLDAPCCSRDAACNACASALQTALSVAGSRNAMSPGAARAPSSSSAPRKSKEAIHVLPTPAPSGVAPPPGACIPEDSCVGWNVPAGVWPNPDNGNTGAQMPSHTYPKELCVQVIDIEWHRIIVSGNVLNSSEIQGSPAAFPHPGHSFSVANAQVELSDERLCARLAASVIDASARV